MNIRKPVDYSVMFAALDTLMAANMPQIELYCEIGKLISSKSEKGAAVAAAEYLCNSYSDASGFSPRNLRRMRDFYRAYESDPAVLAKAMTIGWTQNVVILEADLTVQEQAWYIQAANRFKWSKLELQKKVVANTHMEIALDNTDTACYTEENVEPEETSSYATTQDQQCYGTGSSGSADRLPAVLCLYCPQFFIEEFTPDRYWLVEGVDGPWEWRIEVARRGCSLWQALLQESRTGQPGVVSQPRKLLAQWIRLRFLLRERAGKLSREMYRGHTDSRRIDAVQGSEAAVFGGDGLKGFETVMTSLQMQTYVVGYHFGIFFIVHSFEYVRDKNGKSASFNAESETKVLELLESNLLSNPKCAVQVLLQKKISTNIFQIKNDGLMDRYLYTNTHEAIISDEIFIATQQEKLTHTENPEKVATMRLTS